MSYLNPPYDDNFKELCAAMPLFYLDVFEMREILKAQGRLMDGVCESFELIIDNNFILTADEATIRLWENALQLPRDSSLTLDQRKRVVIGYICGQGHIGEPEIREIVGQYTENSITVAFSKGIITITIEGEIFGETNLLDTLLRRIPAHLALKIILHVRRTFRLDLPVAHAAMLGSHSIAPPISGSGVRSSMEILAARTGFLESGLYGNPPDVKKSATEALNVSRGAFEKPQITGASPNVLRQSRLTSSKAGGVYYHTHIKSKLIE